MTFARRVIDLEFELQEDEQFDDGSNIVKLDGHRVEVIIQNAGNPVGLSQMQLRIFGANPEFMEKFSTYKLLPVLTRVDKVTVNAGDAINGMKTAFQGTINLAAHNFSGAPDVSFDISAVSGWEHQLKNAEPNSYPGSSDVASIIEGLATQMGFSFQNQGVTTRLSDEYLDGTLMNQIRTVAKNAGIGCSFYNDQVIIWPNGEGRPPAEDGIVLNRDTGLVGYPAFTRSGIIAVSEYQPYAHPTIPVMLESDLPYATGTWFIHSMRHELSTVDPDGKWFTTMQLTPEKGFYAKAI